MTKYQGLLSLSTVPLSTQVSSFLTLFSSTYQPFPHFTLLPPLIESIMAVPRSWFPSGLNEGDTITLTKPKTSKWILDRMVNTHDDQCQDRSLDSYASVLFECHNATNGEEAFMRVYVQVPHAGYEDADKATRAREATEFTPPS